MNINDALIVWGILNFMCYVIFRWKAKQWLPSSAESLDLRVFSYLGIFAGPFILVMWFIGLFSVAFSALLSDIVEYFKEEK